MKGLLVAAITLVGVATTARAADSSLPSNPAAAPDVQDVIFFGAKRPILMRLHVLIDGKPFAEVWTAHIKKRFDLADRDKDGFLDETEFKRVPTAQSLLNIMAGNIYGVQGTVPFKEVDGDEDGKISLTELTAYYLRNQVTPVKLNPSPNYSSNYGPNALTEALFKLLDRNNDGKLSREELNGAARELMKLDEDDDETVSTTELLQQGGLSNPYGRLGGFQQVGGGGMMMRPSPPTVAQPGGMAFGLIPREETPNRLTQRLTLAKELLHRYDKDKSGKVTREEIGLPEELFAQLDTNGDKVLDPFEMLRWTVIAPDVEVVICLGKHDTKNARVVVKTDGKRKAPLADALQRVSAETMALKLPGAEVEVSHSPSLASAYRQNASLLFQQLRMIDPGNKGFIDKKKFMDQRYQFYRNLFEMADTDGDDKLTEAEMQAYVALQSEAMTCTTQLYLNDTGRALFSMIDSNKDNRLTPRELRMAAARLAELTGSKDGSLKREMIPYQYQVSVSAGPGNRNYQVYYQQPYSGQQARPTPGPVWFSRMDANADGEVSRREFLGTPAQFEALDTDRDGVISPEEAQQAETRLRKTGLTNKK